MATQEEEEEDCIDSIGQESFHTCGNEPNAKIENQKLCGTTALDLGEKNTVDTTETDERNSYNHTKPLISCAKEQTAERNFVDLPHITSFIKVGLEKKQTARALKPWTALALTLDGRDKITKILQYIFRFLGWYLAGSSFKTQSLRFAAVYKALATSRKAFRLGRSLVEIEKLRPVPGMVLWHLQDRGSKFTEHRKSTVHRGSSSRNIGLGLSMAAENESQQSLSHSLWSFAHQRMYQPLLSQISATMLPDKAPTQELWKICGVSIKNMGLLFFWAGDNCNFLLSTGAFDDYSIAMEERLKVRKRRRTFFSNKANQAYFIGSLAGLLVNSYAYLKFYRESIEGLPNRASDIADASEKEAWTQKVKQLKQKQFSLFLSLLKSCCDVAVFSNQPGIDLHKKWRGRKNHEGLHCMCGLVSAGTVIYNNFPDSK